MNYFLIAALVPLVAFSQFFSLERAVEGMLDFYIYCFGTILYYLAYLYYLAGLAVVLPSFPFYFLFVFRYLRLIVHIISFWCFYRPTPLPEKPTILPKDCSIILPTIDPENVDFRECLESCLYNTPGEIIIVTVGRHLAALTNQIVGPYRAAYPNTHIQVHITNVANKRIQVAHGVGFATGLVTVLLDDHVFWPSSMFLPTILAPFEDITVGAVGTNKRVRRTDTGFNIRSFWNMIGALYLERHNFEIRATNAIDGGVFVISGRTAAYRSSILKEPGFMDAFTNERFFFNMFGPLNADDDNFLTREVVRQGFKIKIQYSDDAMIETTLGTYPKFLSQCLRWVRTTWRSNSASLFTDGTVWKRQPWCVYAVYLTSFVNFALFYDAALIYTLSQIADRKAVYCLIAWIFFTKMVKLTSYFIREPQDLLMLPGYLAFAYFHSLIKLYAGLTFWVTAWGGRNLDAFNQNNDDDDDNNHAGPHEPPPSSSTNTETTSSSSDGGPPPARPRARSIQPPPLSPPQALPIRSRMQLPIRPAPPHAPAAARDDLGPTPWGFIRAKNPASTPANVAESSLPSSSSSPTPIPPKAIEPIMPEPTVFAHYRSHNAASKSSAQSKNLHPSPSHSATPVPRSNPSKSPYSLYEGLDALSVTSAESVTSAHRYLGALTQAAEKPSPVHSLARASIAPIGPGMPTPPRTPTPRSSHSSRSPPHNPLPYTYPSPALSYASDIPLSSSSSSSSSTSFSPLSFQTYSPCQPTPTQGPKPYTYTHTTKPTGFSHPIVPTATPKLPQPQPRKPAPPSYPHSLPYTKPSQVLVGGDIPEKGGYTLLRDRRALGIPDQTDKSWVRGKQCSCLHSDGDRLLKTRSCRCEVGDVWGAGAGARLGMR